MKIDIKQAIKDTAVNCEFEGKPGKAILVTQEIVDEYALDQDNDKYPEVEPGQMVVSYRDGDAVKGKVLIPEARNDIVIMIRDAEGEEVPFSLGGTDDILSAVRGVYDMRESVDGDGADLSEKSVNALNGILAYSDAAFENIIADAEFAAPRDRSNVYSYELEVSRRNDAEDEQLSREDLDKIAYARSMRQTIARVNPAHEDGLDVVANYQSQGKTQEVLDNAGIRIQSQPLNDAIKYDRQLSEEVFGAITRTPISGLKAEMISADGYGEIRQEMLRNRVSGGWAREISDRLSEIFVGRNRMPNYKYTIELFTRGGADVMLVRDHAGAYVYGWDSDSRADKLNDRVMYTAEDVPSDEEIARLEDIVADLRYENGGEIDFDLYGDNVNDDVDNDFDFDNHDVADFDDYDFNGDDNDDAQYRF